MTPEQESQYRKLLGAAQTVTPEQLISQMADRSIQLSNACEQFEREKLELSNSLTAANDGKAKAEKDKLELSRFAPEQMDATHLSRLAGVVEREINASVSEGDLPASIAERLKVKMRKGDAINGVMLSRSPAFDDVAPVDLMLGFFKGTGLGKLTHRGTGTDPKETIVLSRDQGSDSDNAYKEVVERHNARLTPSK